MKMPTIGFRNYLPLLHKGTFAIIDQGLFAGTNFLVYILLARWLTPSQYGSFAVAFSIFLFFGALYTAVIIEPMLVFGSGKYAGDQRRYIAILTYMHICLTLPLGILLVLVGLLLGHIYAIEVQNAMIGLAVSSPMILFLWLTRRAFYVRLKPAWSALGGLFYLSLFLGLIIIHRNIGDVSPASAFLVMGFSSLLVGLMLFYFLRPEWRIARNTSPMIMVSEHWKYGKWALGTAGLSWFPSNVYFVILPSIVGLAGVAAYRALLNLILPLQHCATAFSILLVPILANLRRDSRLCQVPTQLNNYFRILMLISGLYYILLILLKHHIFAILYGSQYKEVSNLIFIVGLVPFTAFAAAIVGSTLRAMEQPSKVFWSYVGASAASLFSGLLLVLSFGVCGAAIGLLVTSFVLVILLWVFYRRMIHQEITNL
jgi:O-antigen/teichoic acid export membrane protein